MEFDFADAERFLRVLTGSARQTFQTVVEAEKWQGSAPACVAYRKRHARILHGTLNEQARTLCGLNKDGCGIYVLVNEGDGKGRSASNIVRARALWVDLDGSPLEPVLAGPLQPRIIVETSPGRWHCYWPVVDLPLGAFKEAQASLCARFGGDPTAKDIAKANRLPGFAHVKREPRLPHLERCEGSPYTWDEVCRAFGLAGPLRLSQSIPAGERNTTLFRMAASASRAGVPESAQLQKALSVNADHCDPPLSDDEVRRIVANAYKLPVQGGAGVPLALLDSDAYKAASDESKALMPIAYRRARPDGLVTLPPGELAEWYPSEKRLARHRKQAVRDGLMTLAVAAPKYPRADGKGGPANVYRLSFPPVFEREHQPETPPINGVHESLPLSPALSLPYPEGASGQNSAANEGEAAA